MKSKIFALCISLLSLNSFAGIGHNEFPVPCEVYETVGYNHRYIVGLKYLSFDSDGNIVVKYFDNLKGYEAVNTFEIYIHQKNLISFKQKLEELKKKGICL